MTVCTFSSKDNDLLDKRKHCFSVQTETGEDLFFSVELDCELLIWEKAFQMATFLEVERIQVRLVNVWGTGMISRGASQLSTTIQ